MKDCIPHRRIYKTGFALPTILIASVVMMIVLLAAVQAGVSIRTALDSQYYNKVAQEAAESGILRLIECFKTNSPNTAAMPKTTGVVYKPDSTSCNNEAVNAGLSKYVLGDANSVVRSRYEITVTSGGSGYHIFTSKGFVDLYRASNVTGAATRTYNKTVNAKVNTQTFTASKTSSGTLFSCGIVNRKTYCWGRNISGELGNGSADTDAYENDITSTAVCTGSVATSRGIFDGTPELPSPYTTLSRVLRPSDGTINDGVNVCRSSALLDHEIDIAAGSEFACAITTTATDNDIQFFNANNNGDWYDPYAGTNTQQGPPSAFSGRRVVCWGSQEFGRLGNGFDTPRSVYWPVAVTTWGATKYPFQVGTSGRHACALTTRPVADSTSNVWCWGGNGFGQMGQGNTSTSNYPTPIQIGPFGSKLAVGNAAYHSCVLRKATTASPFNDVICWGNNNAGQVGDGTDGSTNSTNRFKTPQNVLTNTGVPPYNGDPLRALDIAVGGFSEDDSQTCAIGNRLNAYVRKIFCWGDNTYGQIGQGTTGAGNFPRANIIPSLTVGGYAYDYSAYTIATNNSAVCASVTLGAALAGGPNINGSKRVFCWGSNQRGALGIGSTNEAYSTGTPQLVTALNDKNISSFIGGAYRFCIAADGRAYCWGNNTVGQVGSGQRTLGVSNFLAVPTRAGFLEPFDTLTY